MAKSKKKNNRQKQHKKEQSTKTKLFAWASIVTVIFLSVGIWLLWNTEDTQGHSSQTAQNRGLDQVEQDLHAMLEFGTRLPGSEGSLKTREYIAKQLEAFGWTMSYDTFEAETPIGSINFTNVIATAPFSQLKEDAETVVIAAHYDSKFYENFEFLGITDSLLSVSLLLDFGRHISLVLKGMNPSKRIQLVFFDGEEAYKEWNNTDSIYGAKHLASLWEEEGVLPSVSLFVLLDLIGTKDQQFYSYQEETLPEYKLLYSLEQTFRQRSVLNQADKPLFLPRAMHNARIEDDHLPFLRRGVRVLHLIPMPFPDVWHSEKDSSLDAVDWRVTRDFHQLFLHYLPYLAGCSAA